MRKLVDWLDDRTGIRKLLHEALYERIPGGAKWRYVWGSALVITFSVQVVTGLFLWAAYSPSSQTAWESVYFIQHEMTAGWFVRGLHHFTAQAMVVLLALHVVQVVLAGAYRAPREVNWWLGILLLLVTLGLSLTGYLLPWDQKGYWATRVATNIMASAPGLGPELQRLVVGGSEYGHHTLTRFFALHAGLLPIALVALLVAHIAVFRRHGITHPKNPVGETTFWPQQLLRDAIAGAAVLGIVVAVVIWLGGAHLGPPADPARAYNAARPEWYFLFLFQFLKLKAFEGEGEVLGAVVVPTLVLFALFLFPFFGRWRAGHVLCILLTAGLLLGIGYLTVAAVWEDREDAEYQKAVAEAEKESERILELIEANHGAIPLTGANELLLADPLTQGPRLFDTKCASCHRWNGANAAGDSIAEAPTASDLYSFGREPQQWIRGFLRNPSDPKYLGNTKFKDGPMAQWAAKHVPSATEEELDALAALLTATPDEVVEQIKLRDQDDAAEPSQRAALIRTGAIVFEVGFENDEEPDMCMSCHSLGPFASLQIEPGPDLTGYLAPDGQWLRGMIANPEADKYYGSRNDRMPQFAKQLSAEEIDLLVRWMQGDWPKPSVEASSGADTTALGAEPKDES